MPRLSKIALLLLAASPAPAGARTWGERLLDQAAYRHRGVAGLRVEATGKDGVSIVVARGSSEALAAPLPLTDAMRRPVGTLRVAGHLRRGEAATIAADLSRHLYVAGNLTEPDPFVAGAIDYPRAQALVDAAIAAEPDLVTLAMHVAPPGAPNAIIASSFGRIGKAADKDDADVVVGAIRREVTDGCARLAVELPLLDRAGRTIGALSTSFLVQDGRTEDAYARALAVRARLSRQIASLAALTQG